MAGDAFWHGFVSSDWNTGIQADGSSNWGTAPPGAPGATPTLVPTTVANFPVNALRFDLTFSENTLIATLLFAPGVPVYTFDLTANNLTIDGAGIINPIGNNSPIFELPAAPPPVPAAVLTFKNFSTAGNAIIESLPGAKAASGPLLFSDSSNAGSATITQIETTFADSSNAGSATIISSAPVAPVGGVTHFRDDSSAKFATITNVFGFTEFFDNSTADHATIKNFSGGTTYFGIVGNMGNPTAANATIQNFGGSTRFRETSTAAQATIVNGVTGVGSTTQFEDDGDAGQATITNNDSGFTIFLDKSTADKSTITTEDGGRVTFSDESTGGSARLITKAGGNVDISKLTTAGMTIGSIEGAGGYDLGNRILITGGNNLSTEVSGTIVGGADGTLVKIGSGTLTLTGHNTYSGNTIILGGTLELGAGGSISGGLVFVTPGGFKASSLASSANLASISSSDPTLKLDAPNQISGTIDGFVKGDNIDIAFHNFTAGDHFTWTENVANTGGILSLVDGTGALITTLNLSGVYTSDEFGVASDGSGGTVFTSTVLISSTTIQSDYLAITRTALSSSDATMVANAINASTQTETQYVNGLFSQVANTTIPAVAVEASMYGFTGTSAEITNLTTNFLPAQIANAISHGLNPQVYACEVLGLAFAFGNETGSSAFANNFGPSNSTMPNSAAGDAAFAAAAGNTIFGAASTANLVSVMQTFVSNWKAFYTPNGIPGNATPTADQIDLASRGAAWGDMVGVALANNLGPLNGQVINFLEDAAQGTAIYGASLVGQPAHQPFV